MRDVLAVEGFHETKTKIEEESSLKDKLGTMCHLYDINDNKLYDRAVLMKINDNLDEQINQFLDKKKQLDDIKIDVNYFKTDVRDKLREVRYGLL